MTETTYRVRGLDCPNCAAKLENALLGIDGVEKASIDLMQERIYLEGHGLNNDMVALLQAVADKTERGLTIQKDDAQGAGAQRASHDHDHDHDHEHEHDHEHDHGHGHDHSAGKKEVILLIVAAVAFGLGIITEGYVKAALLLAAWLISGWEVILSSLKTLGRFVVSLFKRPLVNPLDENLLMTIATIGAMALGEYAEGAMVMLLFNLGELLQGMAVQRSRKSIENLMKVKPDHANLVTQDGIKTVEPSAVRVGDIVELRPGERIPLDAEVISGKSAIDTKDMTGESLPRDVEPGDALLSGTINVSGLLRARVVRESGQSAVTRALERIRDAAKGKAPTEKFFTRFARVYTPIVVGAALLLAVVPPLFAGGDWNDWIYRALNFLVISCPCALVLSIPLSFFSGIGAASSRGLLVKGGVVLEQLAKVDAIAFDKTGTLTKGTLSIEAVLPEENIDAQQLLQLAATAESASTHPIARVIAASAEPLPFENMQELAGRGVRCEVAGQELLVGNKRLMDEHGVQAPELQSTGMLVAVGGRFIGSITLSDTLHEDARETVEGLKQRGINTLAMFSGDNQQIAEKIAGELGGMEVRAELLPDQKVEMLKALPGKTVAFVGDGVNDAPCILEADVGIAIGLSGADAAIEAADLVLLQGSPKGLLAAIDLAKRTMANVKQNAGFALIVKLGFLVLATFGLTSMWMAVFADAGVTVLCVLNSLRLLKK